MSKSIQKKSHLLMATHPDGTAVKCCVVGCNKGIKLNVVNKQPHISLHQFKCYKHWDAERLATQHDRIEHAEKLAANSNSMEV